MQWQGIVPPKEIVKCQDRLPLKAAVQSWGWPQPEKTHPKESNVAIGG